MWAIGGVVLAVWLALLLVPRLAGLRADFVSALLHAALLGAMGGVAAFMLQSALWGAVTAALFGLIPVSRVVIMVRDVRRISQLGPDTSTTEAAAVVRLLEARRPDGERHNSYAQWLRLCLLAVGRLTEMGSDEHAELALRLIHRPPPDERLQAMRLAAETSLAMRRGDLQAARAALAAMPEAATDSQHEQVVQVLEALLSAIQGDAEGAEAKLAALGPPRHESIARTAASARAQLLALRDSDAARAELERIANDYGYDQLERVRRLGGPAQDIADALLQEHQGPYR